MDLPIISKYDNFHPSLSGIKMYFRARLGKPLDCGRIKSKFPKAVKYSFSEVKDERAALRNESVTVKEFSREQVLSTLEECEISGCGAGFPTHKKLESLRPDKNGETHLIINAIECDLGLIHDDYVMRRYFNEINAATHMLKQAFGFTDVYMGTTANVDEKSLGFSESSPCPLAIEIRRVERGYPAGAEKILINLLTSDIIPIDKLPAECGYAVLNVQTMLTVYYALTENKKYDGKYITVANMKTRQAVPVYVPFGTSVSEVAAETLGEPCGLTLLCGGGAMSAHAAVENEVTDGSVSLIAYGKPPEYKETTECMSCGACTRACPMDLKINKIADLIMSGRHEGAEAFSPERCIGCSSCTYVCFINRKNSEVITQYNLRTK